WSNRTLMLQSYYDWYLYRYARLIDLPLPPLTFHILATSMTTGRLCSFTREGCSIDILAGRPPEGERLPVSYAVAASSAFPPAFPVVTLLKGNFATLDHTQRLTDGGVYDNMGVELLRQLSAQNDIQVVSDAGASFEAETEEHFSHVVSRTER